MSATFAAAVDSDQYSRLSFLGTRCTRRNIPTVASHRKEVKKKEERGDAGGEGGDGKGKKSPRIPRVCGNRTSPKTLPPSFSAFFSLRHSSSLENLYPAPKGETEGNHVAGTPANIEWADG